MSRRSVERRRSARVEASITLQLRTLEGGSPPEPLYAQTVNLSEGGVCWTSPRFIPPLTRLSLALLVPEGTRIAPAAGPADGAPGALETLYGRIDASAVVVRTLPDAPDEGRDRYQVACVFTGFSNGGEGQLAGFVADRAGGAQPLGHSAEA
jgi:hypothetical protein